MNELDFSFDNSPWELFLSGKREGDRISAAHFLTLLEQETEDAVEDAFAALDDRKLMLDVSDLPVKRSGGPAAAAGGGNCRKGNGCFRTESHRSPAAVLRGNPGNAPADG